MTLILALTRIRLVHTAFCWKQKQTGLYVQDQAQWDKVLVTLGGRYDWADQSSFNRDYGNKSERDDKEFTWRGGVNYLFDNGVTPYFSYSESFEPASELMRTVICLHLRKANSMKSA